jgi:hypothetical protein
MAIEATEIIDRPVADVFRFYAQDHIRNHPRWEPNLWLQQMSDGPIGVGTAIRAIKASRFEPVDGTMEIIEFEPNRSFGVLLHRGATDSIDRATFQEDELHRTRLTLAAECADLDDTARSALARTLQQDLRTIKELIESESELQRGREGQRPWLGSARSSAI